MAETLDIGHAKGIAVQVANPPKLPSVVGTAETVLAEALAFCAQKMGVGGRADIVELLCQGNRAACEYCLYGMAKQVAAFLGAIDENVKEVYVLDYDATPEDLSFGAETQNTRLIHLLVWTQRKTAAFSSFVVAMDRALAQAYVDTIGTRGLTTLLNVEIIDDTDVKQRRGYGAFRFWMHQKPVQIWKR